MKASQKDLQKSKTSLIIVVKKLVKKLKLPIINTTIKENLLAHPEYPALSALSDVLWDWNIENLPVNLLANRLEEIEYPVVAYLTENGGRFVLITSFENGQITYLSDNGSSISKQITEFQKSWDGILLLIGNSEYAAEANYTHKRIDEIRQKIGKWGIGILGLLILILVILKIAPIVGLGILLTKIVGLVISSLLLSKEFGSQYPLLNRICQVNTKTSCDAVLQSPAASFGRWFSLAELGLVYFLGGFVLLALVLNLAITNYSSNYVWSNTSIYLS